MTASENPSVSPHSFHDIDPTSIELPSTPEMRSLSYLVTKSDSYSNSETETEAETNNGYDDYDDNIVSPSVEDLDNLTLEALLSGGTSGSVSDEENDFMEDVEVGEEKVESSVVGEDILMSDGDEEHEIASQSNHDIDTPGPEFQASAEPEKEENSPSQEQEQEEYPTFNFDWLGTSQFAVENSIILQQQGELPLLIAQRAHILAESHRLPYDPTPLLTLAYLDNRLGFNDIAVGNSYRAILLLNAAFNRVTPTFPHNLGDLVQNAIAHRLYTQSVVIVGDEMLSLRLQGYTTLVTGLAGCACFWDGLKQVKIALKMYPTDWQLLGLKAEMETAFEERSKDFPKGIDMKTRSIALRLGKIYQRGPYPWMDKKLFGRSPQLVRDVNENFKEGNLEVRCAFFGPNAEENAKVEVGEGEDVGPLGVFATRDIQRGEMVMVDKSITGISQIPSSAQLCCDACHACLSPPFMDPAKVIRPSCCKAVAYCGRLCHDKAMKSYHKLLCGKDFEWVFKNIKIEGKHGLWRRWRAVCFLRMMAIVITDINNNTKPGEQRQHPLTHHLIARMTAAYSPSALHPKHLYDWQFHEEVTTPTKILQQLGIDIFAHPEYSQEMIQIIYWRCENNANQTKTHLIKSQDQVSLININQNYLFFNHSCLPNVLWHGPPDATVSVEFLLGIDGEMLRPGESAIWCSAARDIKKGEECKISYVGDPLGEDDKDQDREFKRTMLAKWCEDGCGCRVCNEENEKNVSLDERVMPDREDFVVSEQLDNRGEVVAAA